MFGFFKKKENVEFEATQKITHYLEYDANRELVRFNKNVFSKNDIQLYRLKFGSKVYNKVNLGRAAIGGAAFGLAGIILAGTHQEEYVSNITLEIKVNDKFYFCPLTIGKMKASSARGILDVAEKAIAFLDEITD